MREQHGPLFTPVARRTSATAEDLEERQRVAQRRTSTYEGTSRTTNTRQPVRRLTDGYPQASPHRVGHTPGLHPEDAPYQSQEVRPIGSPVEVIEDEASDYPDEQPRRRTTVVVRPSSKATRLLPRTRFHPLVFVGIALFIMIAGWLLFGTLSSWWATTQDDWHYGRPRTYQTDAMVGHGDSASRPSHFIAVNLNGQILVIEIPGGNAAKAQIYIGPRLFGAGEELEPVALSFEDCNGDGKPDLNIHIQGSGNIICFVNNGKTFTSTQQQP